MAKRNNFVLNAKYNVSFITFNGYVFQVSNYYDLNLIITNNYRQTHNFKQYFYNCDKLNYKIILRKNQFIKKSISIYDQLTGKQAYVIAQDNIKVLGPSEFTELLKTELNTKVHMIFLKRKKCNYLINYRKYKYLGLKVKLFTF